MTYQLSKRQVDRIKKSLHSNEQKPRGPKRGAATNKPQSGMIQQGQLSEPVYFDLTVSPYQWQGKMTIWVEPEPSDKTSEIGAVGDDIDDLVVWPALDWPPQSWLDIGSFVVVAWISGRWRIVGSNPCPSGLPVDSDY